MRRFTPDEAVVLGFCPAALDFGNRVSPTLVARPAAWQPPWAAVSITFHRNIEMRSELKGAEPSKDLALQLLSVQIVRRCCLHVCPAIGRKQKTRAIQKGNAFQKCLGGGCRRRFVGRRRQKVRSGCRTVPQCSQQRLG